ncbi:MAG TPA: LysE family transporter [Actinomycetota bacterium]|nr:LysE family transporter [Actinomycetota bacterium]
MTAEVVSPVAVGLGLGVALASAPGPVQAVLLAEALRGGVARGFRALAGANVTFGLLLVCLALGLSVAPPSGLTLRILKVAGGALLLWLAVEGFRSGHEVGRASGERRTIPPAARGALAVLLNPGAWLFLGVVASPIFASATRLGGTGRAVFVAVALVIGLAIGDGAVVVLGGIGVRRAGERVGWVVRRGLAAVLAGLGLWLLIGGVTA